MTKKAELKKTNSYKRMGLVMLCSAAGGGVLGIVMFVILSDNMVGNIKNGTALALTGIQQIMIPVLAVITIVSIVYGELNLRKLRGIGRRLLETEDEECDQWEYTEEKTGAYGMIVNLLSQILCILILSAGYSIEYIADRNAGNMLTACVIFLICYAYDGFWQVRYVKVIQESHPEKQGDPSSKKFRQQWLDSCDEAEKEVIYRSAYASYSQTSKMIPLLLVIVMLGHLFFNTGILAIVIVAVIWLVVTVSYLTSCVSLKEQKLK